MTAIWLGLSLAVIVAVVILLAARRHHVGMAELGTVSQQWIAEQRANDRHYSER